MRYLCLAYEDSERSQALPLAARRQLWAEARHFLEDLRRSGHYLACTTLADDRATVALHRRNRNVWVGDTRTPARRGPLCAVLAIEARDFNEALKLASDWPAVRHGWLEVRADEGFAANGPDQDRFGLPATRPPIA